jgi:predicted  nucleic acid-binding Zn-ribbon protein
MSKTGREPLTSEQKLQAVQSGDRTLRDLGNELDVHHSTIKEVREEAAGVLRRYWDGKSKRVGRPRKEVPPANEELQQLKARAEEAREELALRQMRIEWLELKLKWSDEELREAKVKRAKQLKKKRKKR